MLDNNSLLINIDDINTNRIQINVYSYEFWDIPNNIKQELWVEYAYKPMSQVLWEKELAETISSIANVNSPSAGKTDLGPKMYDHTHIIVYKECCIRND